eukprot:350666-Chlamydomonas_euryale.AAC.4
METARIQTKTLRRKSEGARVREGGKVARQAEGQQEKARGPAERGSVEEGEGMCARKTGFVAVLGERRKAKRG